MRSSTLNPWLSAIKRANARAHHKRHSVRAHARRYGSAGSNMPRGGWPVPRNVEEYLTKIFG
jgi:hypothetical protein